MNNVTAERATMFRKPVRISITLAHSIYMELERKSDEEGRSLSNLAAYLIEGSLRKLN